jgi:hypothetical protein
MKCKWDAKADCKFTELIKRDLVDRDCFFCVAIELSNTSRTLIDILCSVGAKGFAIEFAETFRRFARVKESLLDMAKEYYPEIMEMAKKKADEATIVAPYGIPKEFEEALRKWLDKAKEGVV